MATSILLAANSTNTAQNITATLELNTYTAVGAQRVMPSVRLSAMNGAAATITLTWRHYASDGTTLIREQAYVFVKPQATSTVAGDDMPGVLLANGEKLTIAAKSSNASDTSVTYTISWLDGVAANLVLIAGVSFTDTSSQIAAAFGTFFNVSSPVHTMQSVNQTGDSFPLIGALNTAASSGDPGTTTTLVAYLKQLVNTLEGSAGIPTYPAAAVAGNAVSMAEVIRSIDTRLPAALGANSNLKADVRDLLGTAWLTPGVAGTPDVNTKQLGGQTASLNANNRLKVSLTDILDTALTETAGLIAAAFKKFFNVATPTGTVNSLPDAVPDASGGLPVTGNRLTAIPTVARVTLVDTTTTNTDMRGTDNAALAATALSTANWTNARAGYLDNLNVGGAVASHADIAAINQSASKHVLIQTVGQYERPESGSTSYTVEMRTYSASTGAAVNADSTPTIAPVGAVSGDLSANLGAVSNPATGVYRATYTVAAAATQEQIRFDGSATISSSTFTISCYSQVVDEVSVTWNATNASNLTAIFNKLPTNNIADETLVLAAIPSASANATATAAQVTTDHGSGSYIRNTEPPSTAQILTALGTAGSLDTQIATLATAANLTITNARIGGFVGTGNNTILGLLRAAMNKAAALPSDVGGTYDPATDSLEANRDNIGTAGAGLTAVPSSAGTGSRSVTITVNDGAAVLQGARVRIYLNAGDNQVGNTDVNGVVSFSSAADGTYTVTIGLAGYSFTPTTLSVTANTTHTYSMTQQAVTPATGSQTNGYLYTYDQHGALLGGVTLTFQLMEPSTTVAGQSFPGDTFTGISDSNGLLTVALRQSTDYRARRDSSDEIKGDWVDFTTGTNATYQLPQVLGGKNDQ